MSATKTVIVEIRCDHPICAAFWRDDNDGWMSISYRSVRLDAVANGWECTKGRDLCDEHAITEAQQSWGDAIEVQS